MGVANRRDSAYLWLCSGVGIIAAALVVFSQTRAFAWDEGFHLLAAQLILAGKKPYLDFCFPQPPLIAYWNAFWMRLFGESWRVPHAVSALFTAAATLFIADYCFRRAEKDRWRLPVAASAALMTGLNVILFTQGGIAQGYGMCLFSLVAGYRACIAAVERQSSRYAFIAGLMAGAAAGFSLLSAAGGLVLFLWLCLASPSGSRFRRAAIFIGGALVASLPVLWLFSLSPRQTWFNLFTYQTLYRSSNWTGATGNDLEVLAAWIDSGQALLLGLLAAIGIRKFLVTGSSPPGAGDAPDPSSPQGTASSPTLRERFASPSCLACMLALALGLEAALAHPTFSQYFIFTVPFLAILAAEGLFETVERVAPNSRPAWCVLVLGAFVCLGLVKGLHDRSDIFTWPQVEEVARKTASVTPSGAPLWADENIYFLTRRAPYPGMEFSYSHEIESLPPARAAALHIVTGPALQRRTEAGAFFTIETCDDDKDFIQSLKLTTLYAQRAEIWGCAVYWDKIR